MAMNPRLLRPRQTGGDPDALRYIAAVQAADGQPLEAGVRKAINDFIVGCKRDNIWSAIKASCILAGARTLAGALTPLVGAAPTNFNFVSIDYDRKTGLLGNGSSKYLNSNRNANADPQDNFHMSVAVSASGSGISMGAGSASIGSTQFSGSDIRCRSSSAFTRTLQSTDSGLRAMRRTSSAEFISRALGSDQTHTNASQTPFNGDIFVFARNSSGVGFFTNMRCYWYSIGESLNLALLDARVTGLYSAIGAAIP